MRFEIDKETITEITNEKKRDLDRYYQSLLYILGLKFYFEKNKKYNARFIGSEVVLVRENGNKLKPDSCLQINQDGGGILGLPIEIKSSLSIDSDIFKNLKEMERYNSKLSGWDTKTKEVSDEAIVFSPYLEDSSRVLKVLRKSIKAGDLSYNKELLIWQWSFVQSLKDSELDLLLVQQIEGDLSNKKVKNFGELITDGLRQDINEPSLIVEKERNLFTNQRPPVEYTMLVLWQNIFGAHLNEKNNKVSAEEVTNLVNDYYTESLMKNGKNVEFKFKILWAKEALEMFCNIGMARKLSDSKYEIKLSINNKNFREYICEKVARFEIKKGIYNERIKLKGNKELVSFKHGEKNIFEK